MLNSLFLFFDVKKLSEKSETSRITFLQDNFFFILLHHLFLKKYHFTRILKI
ncbi:hypothetical protein HMPREF1981_00985 [Bacteroides pyogenes F0041]|uniref:Uncharacterized protein n=1 Tax=Bacteroides pyogenes F0041 TaxID=1321819 RepID=U2E1X9_9BACE|nr:hypothetical protein HMPREF1981_00985 [Bacteroides pyogenes F0041]